ncbi:MAG: hypothetical protein ABJC79_00255, partial [Acidimicrobiia bacterium]
VVTFDADSITGMQALALAGADPVVYSYAGQGGAVCRLFGAGRDAGPNCLGGGDGDNRYWAYFRAAGGTSTFTYSRTGAGSTAVLDGDVEGWKFGTGAMPAWSAVPPAATTTTGPAVANPGVGSGPAANPSASAGSGGPPVGATPEQIAAFWAAARAAASTTTSTTSPPAVTAAANDEVRGRNAPRASGRVSAIGPTGGSSGADHGGGGSPVAFAIVAAALVSGALWLRRSRRTHGVS